jgi:hypothetical protein
MIIFFLVLLLALSLTANVIFTWYTRALVKNLVETYSGIDKFQDYLEAYILNVQGVYELTDYYGDQTIKGLIDDSKSVVEACQNFKASITNVEVEEKNETKTE